MVPGKDTTYRVGPCSLVVGKDPTEDAMKYPQNYSTASNPCV